MKKEKIPQTDSIRELANFWDTHDLTDFENDLEEVHDPVFEPIVPLTLSPQEVATIASAAKSRGISPVTLIKEWVTEGINELEN